MRCFSGGISVITRCRNSDVSSRRRSGDSTPLTTTLRANACNLASSSGDNSRPVNTITGISDRLAFLLSSASTSNPDMSGNLRSSTMQSQAWVSRYASASAPVVTASTLMSPCASSSRTLSCSAGLSSISSSCFLRGAIKALIFSNAVCSPSLVVGFGRNANAPVERPCWRSSSSVII